LRAPRRGPQQFGELTCLDIVSDDDERATWPQYPHNLSQPRVAAWREEVGEARVHDVDGPSRQRYVLGRPVQDADPGVPVGRQWQQAGVRFHPDHLRSLVGVTG
jgi:hypothetical protein